MAAQDQNGGAGNCISSNMGVPSARSIQQSTHDEQAIKVRKPYTIRKQRERWTEEEHKKFLDALKLYGRAWRCIEEHVGTKTAVQIRSHAQKFFSKVVRESNGDDVKSVKPIEIPPPRPKRKPKHPYPRKLVIPEEPSPNSGKENRSPTSVLGSEGQPSAGSSPNASPSCVSSATGILLSKHCNMLLEENADPPSPGKLELFPPDDGYVRESSTAQYLKLFGKTVLVIGSHKLPCVRVWKTSQTRVNERAATLPFSWELPCAQVHNPIPIKARTLFDNKDMEDKEDLKEGSSNSGSCSFKPTEIVIFEQRARSSTNKRAKGFVPYKRCLAERATHSPTITSEEREEHRTCLCL